MLSNIPKIGIFILSSIFLLFVVSSRPAIAAEKDTGSITMKGNLLVHKNATDFIKGITEDTVVSYHNGLEKVELALKGDKYVEYGIYTSAEIKTAPFKEMIISWNANTPKGTYVTVEAQVKVESVWSEWFSWGVWKTSGDSGSSVVRPQSQLADIDTDTLTVKNGKKASAFHYRLKLFTDNIDLTPSIRLVAVTIGHEQNIPVVSTAETDGIDKLTKVLDVPMYSQQLRDPKIASRICSPTSLAMVMNYYGIKKLPEEVAWGAMDYVGNVFGNWPFNCAYAGSYGLDAYVTFCHSVKELKQEIVKGHPVIVSVAYRNSKDVAQNYPVLDNAPIPYTAGHLLVVRGFIYKNGKEFVVVNDPAASDDYGVYREYLLSQFEQAWVKVAYMISQDSNVSIIPQRIEAKLTNTGVLYKNAGNTYSIYVLKDAGSIVDISADNARSIVVQKTDKTQEFIVPGNSKSLLFDIKHAPGKYKVIVIAKNNKVYETELNLQ